tara:strand:- start:1093 stop:1272 length:180 start_codon:yes stop_codon:yes gene_type:complete
MSPEGLQASPQNPGYATRERRWRRGRELTDAQSADALPVFGKKWNQARVRRSSPQSIFV